MNIVHEVRHLFCGHGLAAGGSLEAGKKKIPESALYYPGLVSQENGHMPLESRKSCSEKKELLQVGPPQQRNRRQAASSSQMLGGPCVESLDMEYLCTHNGYLMDES